MKTFLKRMGLCLTGFFILLVLFHLIENVRGKRSWKNWKKERIAAGDSYDPESFAPPEIPDSENFAKALKGIDRSAIRFSIYTKNDKQTLGDWKQGQMADLEALKQELKLKNWDGMLSEWEPFLSKLTKAAQLPPSRMFAAYGGPTEDYVTPFLGLRPMFRALSLRSLIHLNEKRANSAMGDVITGLKVVKHLQQEPQLLAQLTHNACLNILMQPLWEGLQKKAWNDAQLQTLQKHLEAIDLLKGWSRCWRYERAFMTQFVLNEDAILNKELDMAVASQRFEDPNRMHKILFNGFVPQGWYFQNQIYLDRFFLSLIQSMDVDNHRIHPDQARKGMETLTQESPYRHIFANVFPGETVPIDIKRAARTQSALDMAILSCALERHHVNKGSYPEKLASLHSDLLPQAPRDLLTGQILCYRPTASGYQLYSTGWNLKDEGGLIHKKTEEGDWVWCQ